MVRAEKEAADVSAIALGRRLKARQLLLGYSPVAADATRRPSLYASSSKDWVLFVLSGVRLTHQGSKPKCERQPYQTPFGALALI